MKKNVLAPVLAAMAASIPAVSMAEVTGNIGWASDYVFRGIFQEDSSAYAGADYTSEGGFYIGTWWADVGQGNETDIYFGYTGGDKDKVTYKIGYTGYRYLDDFDGDYDEINLGLYAGIFALDVAVGTYDGDKLYGIGDQDYVFTSVTLAPEKGPYYKLGMWSGDYKKNVLFPNYKTAPSSGDANYLEVGYTYSLEDPAVDLSVALIYSPDLIVQAPPSTGDYTLTFGIKKTFSMKK